MLGEPKSRVVEDPADLLPAVSTVAYQRLHPRPVGDDPGMGWIGVADLLVDPHRLEPLVADAARRFRSDDRSLLVAQVAREALSVLTAATVDLWIRQRRLLDLSAANVRLRPGESGVVAGVRRPNLAVLADDPLAGHPEVAVIDEAEMFARLLAVGIGRPVRARSAPPGPPNQTTVAAVAAVVAAVRQVVRCGDRHLWGTVALAAANTAARVGHTLGPQADRDLARLLVARPDLARTIELVTVADDPADRRPCSPDAGITFAVRLTCCLLYQLPDGQKCGTCSLQDRDVQVAWLADWFRRERRRLDSSQG